MRRPPAVARVLERVTRTAREHEMFAKGDTVLVSVSGGPDSVCLLYSLWHLRRLFAIRLEVFHFDHRLRADSAKDAEYVGRLADRLKLPFHLRSTDDGPRKGESVEAWATVERTNAANEVRTAVGAGGDRRGSHARRPSRDGPAEPDPWRRPRGDRRNLAGDPHGRHRPTPYRR